MEEHSIYKSIPPSDADKFAQRAKQFLEDTHIRTEAIDSLKVEQRTSQRLDLSTLEYMIELSGEPGMTLALFREIVFRHINNKKL